MTKDEKFAIIKAVAALVICVYLTFLEYKTMYETKKAIGDAAVALCEEQIARQRKRWGMPADNTISDKT